MPRVLIELGSLRISTGKHNTPPPPVVSADTVEKRLPPGARVTRDFTDQVAPKATGAPAQGQAPDPGPLPAAAETPRTPIRFGYQFGYNQHTTPGRGRLTPFAVLRQLARFDITRICIETRKDQICGLEWAITPKKKNQASTPRQEAQIAEATAFFAKPDKRRDFRTWLRLLCEEVFVIDAMTVYRRRTRGGQLYALEVKDGATIVPLLDDTGDTPLPPSIAYRQIINGQPVEGGDCTTEQLYYRPRCVSVDTPYGLSPTEAVLLTINSALQRATFNLAHYSDGNIPRGLMSAPEGWTAQQIKDFQVMFDEMLVGDVTARSRMRLVGAGMAESFKQYAEPDFSGKFDEFLLKVNCAAFGVTPSELGFTADINKSTSQGQENITYRRGMRPLKEFFQDFFTEILATDFGMPDLAFTFIGGEPEDKLMDARVDEIYLRRGVIGADDVRVRKGLEPIGLGPTIDTSNGPVPVSSLLQRPSDGDPDTSEVRPPADALADDETEADQVEAAKKELRDWKTVALKDVKAGRSVRAFSSTAIPVERVVDIRQALGRVSAAGDVVRVFDNVDLGIDVAKREYRVFTGASRVAQTRFRRHFADAFTAQGLAIAQHLQAAVATEKVLKSAADISLLLAALEAFPWAEWSAKHLLPGFQAVYRDLVIKTAQGTVRQQGGTWNPTDPMLSSWMTGYVGSRITQLTGTTKLRVINLIRQTLAGGQPMTTLELAKLVFDTVLALFSDYSRWRANTIARTETAFALNHGTLLGYHQVGVTHVDVFDGEDDDEPCRLANGATWTIAYALEHAIEHPNCVRTFAAHVPKPKPQETT